MGLKHDGKPTHVDIIGTGMRIHYLKTWCDNEESYLTEPMSITGRNWSVSGLLGSIVPSLNGHVNGRDVQNVTKLTQSKALARRQLIDYGNVSRLKRYFSVRREVGAFINIL